jgi:hypothetical protein
MRTLVPAFRLAILIAASCLAAGTLVAQPQSRADVLSGRVTDLAGKPVADAQVISTAPESGVSRAAITDADGHYRIFFPGTASEYQVQAKRMGLAPAQRSITRRTREPEQMTIDLQLGGAPLALSMVEITGSSDGAPLDHEADRTTTDATVPNPVVEVLAMKDTLHLSAVQIVALNDIADTLQSKNSRIYRDIRTLIAKSAEAGDATQMAGSVAAMLEEASGNTSRAVVAAQKLLRPEQWETLPAAIRTRSELSASSARH